MESSNNNKSGPITAGSGGGGTAGGLRTIESITEIPVVNAALSNACDYYDKVKERNTLLRTSLNLAELSVKTMAFAATPIASLCKKPIDSVDSYLADRIKDLEHSYPVIVKPADQLTASLNSQAKLIYNKTVQEPIDMLNSIKDRTLTLGANTVQNVVKRGVDSVDAALETRIAKLLTNPVLDFTEKSLDYLLPPTSSSPSSSSSLATHLENQPTTLRRIFDINNRLYQYTFVQLGNLHAQFELTINKLQTIKTLFDSAVNGSKQRLSQTLDLASKNSLVARCASVIDKNNLSLAKIETLTRDYSRAILGDVNQILEKYMNVVKNFPIVFNGTRLKQTVDNLLNSLNKESFSSYLTVAIDQLKSINQSLWQYTDQMKQVVSENRLVQMLNPKPVSSKSESNGNTTTETKCPAAAVNAVVVSGSSSNHNNHQQQHHPKNNKSNHREQQHQQQQQQSQHTD